MDRVVAMLMLLALLVVGSSSPGRCIAFLPMILPHLTNAFFLCKLLRFALRIPKHEIRSSTVVVNNDGSIQ